MGWNRIRYNYNEVLTLIIGITNTINKMGFGYYLYEEMIIFILLKQKMDK